MCQNTLYLSVPRVCFFLVLNQDVFVYHDQSLTSWKVIIRIEHLTKCFELPQKLRARLGLK